MDDNALGFSLLVLGALMNASFTLPMKYARRWAWENVWAVWTACALWILPTLAALTTVPSLGQVYERAGMSALLGTVAGGAGWGVAQVLFGLAVVRVGIALTFSIVLGLSATAGSLLPALGRDPGRLLSLSGTVLLAGNALLLVGVGVCAAAGRRREAAEAAQGGDRPSGSGSGIALAVVCGLLASLFNVGMVAGGPIMRAAEAAGADATWAPNAVWLPLMFAGSVPNLGYAVWLLRKNTTAGNFAKDGTGSHWIYAGLMAVLWFGSNVLYGIAARSLGAWGPVLGWPVFMSLIVITASVIGVLTGEWKAAGPGPLRVQLAGVAVLVLATFVLSQAGRLEQPSASRMVTQPAVMEASR